jgi:eukaryotic-like serine/threonine-protein kinase
MERSMTTRDMRPDPPTEKLEDRLVLGRYRLERRLGAGGFGVVWLAFDEKLEREVAVKVIQRDGDGPVPARVEREARVAARLNHPGIVGLYELGSDDQAVYLVSELVRGRTFGELLRGGALSDRDVARIGSALCDALAHAHVKDVVHRDVKPGNVMVLAEPAAGAGFAKLTDFGVAHLADGETLTRTGDVVGTLAYMAPEQFEGRRVGPEADVYSLALTLYEGWTGTNPVRARNPAATARRVGTPLPPLRSRRRDLPGGLCRMIDLALDPRPERRPPLRVLREELDETQAQLSEEGGLVEPGTLERFGLMRTEVMAQSAPGALHAWAARVGAGLGAGALALAGFETLGPEPPFSALAAAGIAAALTAVLPRVGWILTALAVVAWLASPEAGREGTALVLAAALAPTPLLLPRAGWLWSAPALAPLLGAVALAPLFVAVAGLASTAWRRAGLAVAGFLWLIAAEAISGSDLLFGAPDGTGSHQAWDSSVMRAAEDAVAPVFSSPALAPLAVWAVFAVLLGVVVRGRFFWFDLAGGALWAAGLVAAHSALADLLRSSVPLADARGAVAGAVLGCVVALAAAGAGLARRSPPQLGSESTAP